MKTFAGLKRVGDLMTAGKPLSLVLAGVLLAASLLATEYPHLQSRVAHADTDSVGDEVPASVGVTGEGVAPVIECKWELPDVSSVEGGNGMQYGQDDDPFLDPNFPCNRVNETGEKPAQADNAFNVIQVVPNAEDQPEAQTIENWAAVEHPNGVDEIDDVFWKVFHPDGSFKIQVHGTKVEEVDSGDGPTNLDDVVDLDDLGSYNDPDTMFGAAHSTGQVSQDAIHATDWGIIDLVTQRQVDLWYARWDIHKEQLCGLYTVETTAVANGVTATLTNTLDIRCFFNLEIDFEEVNWGNITPGGTKVLAGDTNFGSSQFPTVKNTGNSGMQVGVYFSKLLQQNISGPKEITVFDAAFGKSAQQLQWIDPINAHEEAWFSNQSLDQVLCANEVGKLDLSIHPPSIIPAGTYAGTVTVLAGWAPGLCHSGMDTGTLGFPDTPGGGNRAPFIVSSGAGMEAQEETEENDTFVVDVEVSDDSDAENAGISYQITGGSDASLFQINPTSGLLEFISPPDFETPLDDDSDNIYQVQVAATDSDGATGDQLIHVTVLNVNEPPAITTAPEISIPENQAAAADIESTDPEGETENGGGLTYAITGGADSGAFGIDADTGALAFNSAPDFENPADADASNTYEVEVTVTDSGSLTDVQLFIITVTDVNEPPTITSGAAVSVPEQQTSVMDVDSTDPEGETENGGGLSYSITGGDDGAAFSIDPNTGILTFNSAPDAAAPGDLNTDNVYEVQVTVTDSGALVGVQLIQVTVTNVNGPPMITSDDSVSVPELQTAAIDVDSTDPDGETEDGGGLTYAITGGADGGLFQIDPNIGWVVFNSAPDFENPGDADGDNIYEVEVTVTDAGLLTDVQVIMITVTDVAESAPASVPQPAPSAAPAGSSNNSPSSGNSLALPLGPSSLSAQVGNQSITLNWSPPPGPIVGYRVLLDTGESMIIAAQATQYVITGLPNGEERTLQFRSANSAGFSEPMTLTGLIPRTVPAAPHSLQILPQNDDLILSWLSGENGGAPITGFNVEVDFGNQVVADSTALNQLTLQVPGDAPQALFRVAAINEAGQGDFSGWSSALEFVLPLPAFSQALVANSIWAVQLSDAELSQLLLSLFGPGFEFAGQPNLRLSVIDGVMYLSFGDAGPGSEISLTGLEPFSAGRLSISQQGDQLLLTLQLSPEVQLQGFASVDTILGTSLRLDDLSLIVTAQDSENPGQPSAVFHVVASALTHAPGISVQVNPPLDESRLEQLLAVAAELGGGEGSEDAVAIALVSVVADEETNSQLGTNVVTFFIDEDTYSSLLESNSHVVVVKESEDGSTHTAVASCEATEGGAECTAEFIGEAGGFSTFLLASIGVAEQTQSSGGNSGSTGASVVGTPEPEPTPVPTETPAPTPEPQATATPEPAGDIPLASIGDVPESDESWSVSYWLAIAALVAAGAIVLSIGVRAARGRLRRAN